MGKPFSLWIRMYKISHTLKVWYIWIKSSELCKLYKIYHTEQNEKIWYNRPKLLGIGVPEIWNFKSLFNHDDDDYGSSPLQSKAHLTSYIFNHFWLKILWKDCRRSPFSDGTSNTGFPCSSQ